MSQRHCTLMRSAPTVLAFVLLLLPVLAAAQCSFGAANDDDHLAVRSIGWMVIGQDTVMVRSGNSFLIDCDAHLQTVTATIHLTGYVKQEIDPLEPGDVLRCEIFDSNKNLVMTELGTIPDVPERQPVPFDFSSRQFRLAAGLYYYLISPVERKWSYITLGTEYTDGAYQQVFEFYGTWGEQSGDSMFAIEWDPTSGLVAAEPHSWGSLKAIFR